MQPNIIIIQLKKSQSLQLFNSKLKGVENRVYSKDESLPENTKRGIIYYLIPFKVNSSNVPVNECI